MKESFECYKNLLLLLNEPNQAQQHDILVKKMMIHRSNCVIGRILFELNKPGSEQLIESFFLEGLNALISKTELMDKVKQVKDQSFDIVWNTLVEELYAHNILEVVIQQQKQMQEQTDQQQNKAQEQQQTTIESQICQALRETCGILVVLFHSEKLPLCIVLETLAARIYLKHNNVSDALACLKQVSMFYSSLSMHWCQIDCWVMMQTISNSNANVFYLLFENPMKNAGHYFLHLSIFWIMKGDLLDFVNIHIDICFKDL